LLELAADSKSGQHKGVPIYTTADPEINDR